MTSQDIDRIVTSVLRDYGVRMTVQEVARLTDSWDVVLERRDKSPLHIVVVANSPHDVRRALMSALKIDG